MKISVFTPTHNPAYLQRARNSLAGQTYRNFEWVIVPNQGVKLDEESLSDGIPELKICPFEGFGGKIGALKLFACLSAEGEILVELDHDDELTPDCLEILAEEFSKDPELDFAYSNTCDINKEYTTIHYGFKCGWKYLPFKQIDNTLLAQTVAFAPSPASFGRIHYAPDHVRAWRASFYKKIGGHDKTMMVLDDHDLLCRTYVEGKVKHIDKCLYVYYLHGQNSYAEPHKNKMIQKGTVDLYNKYIEQLVAKWCRLNDLRQITLKGDGMDRANTEIFDTRFVENRQGRWPFEDNSVGVFHANQALPYFEDPVHAMTEIYRCLAPQGWLLSTTPSTDGRGAFMNPRYKSYWNANSFLYYTNKNFAQHIGGPVQFQCYHIDKFYYPEEWYRQVETPFVAADLVKIPPFRTPGRIDFDRAADVVTLEPTTEPSGPPQ